MVQAIAITLNGKPREVPMGQSLAALLERCIADGQLRRGTFAVEVNRTIVRSADQAARTLASGDSVEIVTLVGGG